MNPIIDYWACQIVDAWACQIVDAWVWQIVQLYYAPFIAIVKGGEVQEFVEHFSLNGIKSFNICNPQ